ncbi:hypothetical protein GCM10008905_11310 [Clostridium malenominatum]|uniref:Flavoprotein domain-containing protein n=1 Tax=Clostridium malenominatum TaxID=1539 RepID=A0ABN1ITR2_9CLOT
MEYDELIDILANEVLKRLGQSKRDVLILLSEGKVDVDGIVNEVKKIKEDGHNVKILLPKNDGGVWSNKLLKAGFKEEEIYTENEVVDEDVLLRNVEMVLIPVFTMNTLAKVALGISDSVLTLTISKAIMTGIPMVAARDSCDIEMLKSINISYANIPSAYEKKIKDYFTQVREYGIKFVNLNFLHKTICNKSDHEIEPDQVIDKKLITEEDIRLADKRSSKKVRINSSSIVTALARDTARELGVEIECI